MVKPDINSVEVHPQLSHNGHPVDAFVCWWVLGSLWLFTLANSIGENKW
jgi:hypothetical protein